MWIAPHTLGQATRADPEPGQPTDIAELKIAIVAARRRVGVVRRARCHRGLALPGIPGSSDQKGPLAAARAILAQGAKHMARDYGDVSIQEKVENQIRALDACISNLTANATAPREQLIPAADNALGVLKGTRALLEQVIPYLKDYS